MPSSSSSMTYEGANFLRARLALATLQQRTLVVRRIRDRGDPPGLDESEASLLRLLFKVTNGSRVELDPTGTALEYRPGALTGGRVEHECNPGRGVGYFLELLLLLAPWCREPLEATLTGVTHRGGDTSPDLLRASALPVLRRHFLVDDGMEIKVLRRGAAGKGGGKVLFRCPVVGGGGRALRSIRFTDQGKIRRVRGTAWAVRVSPSVANRVVESAKGVLLQFLPDVYIYTDHSSSSSSSPGFGLTLTAETTTGAALSAEVTSSSSSSGSANPTVPEDLGTEGAHALLEEIFRGGCVDSTVQSLQFLLMARSQRDVSKVLAGPLSSYSIHFLRLIRDFFGTTFKLEEHNSNNDKDEDADEAELRMGADKVVLTCVGSGEGNLNRRTN